MQPAKPEIDIALSIIHRLGMDIERGVDPAADQREYDRSMRRRYGKKGLRFMNHMDRRHDDPDNLYGSQARKGYRLKNSDWRMSLQVSQHAEAEKHAAFIEWLCQADLAPPTKACEIGCDIGIQACAMKLLWPESHIVGFDQVNEAIRAAASHAKSLALRGIEFEQLDLRAEPPQDHLGSFDLVVCPWTLHEIVPSTIIPTEDLREESRRSPDLDTMQVVAKVIAAVRLDEGEKQALKNLSDLLKPGGQIVAVDRRPWGQLQQRPITRQLETLGFESVKSDQITTERPSGTEQFPIFVLRKVI